MQHEWNPCTAARRPETLRGEIAFASASEASLEQLRHLFARVAPLGATWTQRDVEGLLCPDTRFEERLRELLVELAPPCPVVVVSGLKAEPSNAPLERILYELGVEWKTHPENFSDEPFCASVSACLLSFTAPAALRDLAGPQGIIETFGYWPATLRETLSVLKQIPAVFRKEDIAICGSVGRRELDWFPYLSRFAPKPSLEGRNGNCEVRPKQHLVVAFAKTS